MHVLTELEQLQAIETAYSDPERLLSVVSSAADAEEAVAGIRREFGLSDELAWTVADQQLLSFTVERLAEVRAMIARNLSGERAAHQAPEPQAREVSDWVEIVLYDLAPGQSRIGWRGTSETSHVAMFNAAIRELTNMRDRLIADESGTRKGSG